jgi:hypothetical protein
MEVSSITFNLMPYNMFKYSPKFLPQFQRDTYRICVNNYETVITFIGFLSLVENNFRFFFTKRIDMFIRVIQTTVSTISAIDLFVCCLNKNINMLLKQIHTSEVITSPVASRNCPTCTSTNYRPISVLYNLIHSWNYSNLHFLEY